MVIRSRMAIRTRGGTWMPLPRMESLGIEAPRARERLPAIEVEREADKARTFVCESRWSTYRTGCR